MHIGYAYGYKHKYINMYVNTYTLTLYFWFLREPWETYTEHLTLKKQVFSGQFKGVSLIGKQWELKTIIRNLEIFFILLVSYISLWKVKGLCAVGFAGNNEIHIKGKNIESSSNSWLRWGHILSSLDTSESWNYIQMSARVILFLSSFQKVVLMRRTTGNK